MVVKCRTIFTSLWS